MRFLLIIAQRKYGLNMNVQNLINKHTIYFIGLTLLSIGLGLVEMSATPFFIMFGSGLMLYSAILALNSVD